MLGLLKKLFSGKPAETAQPEAAPYKIETVEAAPAPTSVAEKATEAVVKSVAPAKKAPAKKQQAAKKPSAEKKPRAPRKPKSQA